MIFLKTTVCVLVAALAVCFAFPWRVSLPLTCTLVGCGVGFVAFQTRKALPSLFLVAALKRLRKAAPAPEPKVDRFAGVCRVCLSPRCSRDHKNQTRGGQRPPEEEPIVIQRNVDEAIRAFIDRFVDEYVRDAWYADISEDKSPTFLREAKIHLARLAVALIHRIRKVDLPTLVCDKILPAAMTHLHARVRALRAIRERLGRQDEPLSNFSSLCSAAATRRQFFGGLHVAASSREAEAAYLRNILDRVLGVVLSPTVHGSSATTVILREIVLYRLLVNALDAASDPHFISRQLIAALEDDDEERVAANFAKPDSPLVFLLANYPAAAVNAQTPSGMIVSAEAAGTNENSAFTLNLTDILSSRALLFHFMKFMEEQGALNLLQFVLDCESLNDQLTQVEPPRNRERLLVQAQDMFRMYVAENATDPIDFPREIRDEVAQLMEEPNAPLPHTFVTAYYDAIARLGAEFCPLFRASEHYYKILVAGKKFSTRTKEGKDVKRPSLVQAKKSGGKSILGKITDAVGVTGRGKRSDAASGSISEDTPNVSGGVGAAADTASSVTSPSSKAKAVAGKSLSSTDDDLLALAAANRANISPRLDRNSTSSNASGSSASGGSGAVAGTSTPASRRPPSVQSASSAYASNDEADSLFGDDHHSNTSTLDDDGLSTPRETSVSSGSIAPSIAALERSDMAQWTVRIPSTELVRDPNKKYSVYIIEVARAMSNSSNNNRSSSSSSRRTSRPLSASAFDTHAGDSSVLSTRVWQHPNIEGDWAVSRRYHEFLLLHAGLRRLHAADIGELELPGKKTFGTFDVAFVEERRFKLEGYLQLLLRHRALHVCSLLRAFLQPTDDFTELSRPFSSSVSIRGRLLRFSEDILQGPTAFEPMLVNVSEQRLPVQQSYAAVESALASSRHALLAPATPSSLASLSTQHSPTPDPTTSRSLSPALGAPITHSATPSISDLLDDPELDHLVLPEPPNEELYDCDLNLPEDKGDPSPVVCEEPFDFVTYVVTEGSDCAFHRPFLTRVVGFLKFAVADTFRDFITNKIEYVLRKQTTETELIEWIKIISEIAFNDEPEPTAEEKEATSEEAWKMLIEFAVVRALLPVAGRDALTSFLRVCVDYLKDPEMSRQLIIVLLDIILAEMFPELSEEKKE